MGERVRSLETKTPGIDAYRRRSLSFYEIHHRSPHSSLLLLTLGLDYWLLVVITEPESKDLV